MLKRNIAVIIVAGLVLGGSAAAWAGGGPPRPTLAAQTGATPTTPADRQAKREAVRVCLEKAAGDAAARRACLTAAGVAKAPGGGGAGKAPGAGDRKVRPPLDAVGALAKAVHGSVVVPGEGGTWQTVTFDRGTVNATTDGSKIVLDRPDGQKVTLALTADTRYRGIAGAAAIVKGKPALVVSKDGKATVVVQKDKTKVKRPGGGNNGDAPVVPND